MPIYEYECSKCGHHFEVRQSFNDKPIERCQQPGCNGKVHRVFSPPAIIFRGSGFHVTDYGRNGPKSKDSAGSQQTESKSSDTKSSSNKE